jgi:hypothetical protein
MAPVGSIVRKQAPNWRVATIRTSTVGLRRVASHGIISTDASVQTTATSTIKDEANLSSLSARSSTISSAPRKVATSEGAREAAAAPLEIGEHAVSPLGVQCTEALFEVALVIHAGPLLVPVTRPVGERWFADPGRLW